MISRAESIRVMYPLFQTGQGGSTPTSALDLRFSTISLDRLIELNHLWHSRLPRLSKSNLVRTVNRASYAAEYDGIYYAVAIWTNPVARLLPQMTCLELRRLAIAPDSPRNTASRMLGWMVRDIKGRFPGIDRLVSYQDTDVHTGGIYKASGWEAESTSKGDDWVRPNRERQASQTDAAKVRWEKMIR